MRIELLEYESGYEAPVLRYIISFFGVHHARIGEETAREDLRDWTQEGHEFYVILRNEAPVGFVHLCMRGPTVCWIEDIFVEESMRGQGIATGAIRQVEKMLAERGVMGICMDVVPDNMPALRLYHRLGYDRLSIVTVRKDMQPFETARTEQIGGLEFRVRKFED